MMTSTISSREQRATDMRLELRRGAERRQCRHRGDLARAQIEPGPGVDIAEGEFHQIPGEIGSDVGKLGDDALGLGPVDLRHPRKPFS